MDLWFNTGIAWINKPAVSWVQGTQLSKFPDSVKQQIKQQVNSRTVKTPTLGVLNPINKKDKYMANAIFNIADQIADPNSSKIDTWVIDNLMKSEIVPDGLEPDDINKAASFIHDTLSGSWRNELLNAYGNYWKEMLNDSFDYVTTLNNIVPQESLGSYLKEEAQQTFAPVVWLVSWLGNVMEKTTGKAMDWAWQKMFWEQYSPVSGVTEKTSGKILWPAKEWIRYKIWETIWETLPWLAATSWLWTISGTLWTRIAKWAAQGALSTQATSLVTEWKPATLWETLVWAWLGSLTAWVFWTQKTKSLEKLVQPKFTPTEEAERSALGLKKISNTWKVRMLPTKQETEMIKVAPRLKPGKSVITNLNKSLYELNKETDDLVKIVQKNPLTFATDDIISRMDNVEKPVLLKWDLEKAYDDVKTLFRTIIDKNPKTAEWLLKSRKEFDYIINQQMPNLYNSETLTPLKVAIKWLRKIPNEFLNENIWDDIVKTSLNKQSLLIDLVDNLSTKTEKTWTSAVSRRWKNNKRVMWTIWWIGWTYAAIRMITKALTWKE